MLQIKNISKQYKTGELVQNALVDVSLSFRNSEFVSVLGPSGSGKTTLLNIIGGLDRYDSGDLIINGISTKEYKDRDWDTYRNHTIGFVFQSYNLIPHQSVLTNVELALTIGGVSKAERRKRAKEALSKVGLADQMHKKPNQLSGGQMQRVAIARALVNDPEILLADEPTGALDTETSVQVMELLKEVSEDRLVIMVTHNPELANEYSTRIINLRDGKIIGDSDPYISEIEEREEGDQKKGRARMSFATALSLSFQNLRTKKGRTILTAFAGSIGIIGIALILALSSGVNDYISDIQKETMTSYPITISAETIDVTSIMGSQGGMMRGGSSEEETNASDAVYADSSSLESEGAVLNSVTENDLTAFKQYLDDPDSEIQKYLGENGVIYSYDVNYDVYTYDSEGTLLNTDTDPEDLTDTSSNLTSGMMGGGMGNMSAMFTQTSDSSEAENFSELTAGASGEAVSQVVTDSYEVLYGSWPENYDEVVLVLDENNEISTEVLYQLGIITASEYMEIYDTVADGEEVSELSWDYDHICGQSFYLIAASDCYEQNEDGTFSVIGDQERLMENAVELKITGIIRPVEDAANAVISTALAYTSMLTDYVIERCNSSEIVKAQEETPEINVLTGVSFEEENAQDTYLSDTSYEDNMAAFGMVSYDAPSSISIYADSFEDKDAIAVCIENYNKTADSDTRITYTDYVALLTSSITSIVNAISYVLIAFVAVSLIVSCIMIGIITHISVLERTKEIGILRALGASKSNVSQVFNAETFIIGLCAGILGVGISALLTIPINAIIQALLGAETLRAALPVSSALWLIILR